MRAISTWTVVLAGVVGMLGIGSSGWALSQSRTEPASGAELSAADIVARAIERSEQQIESEVEADFEARMLSAVDTVNGDGEVTDTETSVYRRYGILGAMFDELVEKEGRPLTAKERREELERREEFEREVRERRAAGLPPQPEDERAVRFDSYLMQRYETAILGEEMVRGHLCWVISMQPRPGKLPERDRMDQALNRATGRLWIAQDDFGVARVEFILRDPIKYLGGFLATVRKTDGLIEIDRVEPGVWLPSSFELQLDLRVLFKSIRRVITTEWTDYRRVAAGPASP